LKIERLIGILSILLQKDKVTSSELAEKFEVSRRTILRDIDTLNISGIPIVSDRGNGGGISIMDGYRIDRTLLSSDDMQAILSGLRSLDSVSGTGRYRQLMERIKADETAVNAGNHIIIDLSNWDKRTVADKIELIKTAMEQRKTISFCYCSPNGESKREIEPYHLIFQWASWYVWGYCRKRRDYRMFKLTRMTGLALTGEQFGERDVPEYTCDKLRHINGDIKATVRFDKSQKWRLIDEFGPDLIRYDDDGNIILDFFWSDVPALYSYVLSYGDTAEIISPEEYRTGFKDLLKKTEKKYEI
jgi:predicted DNA-binding transcriptional regulator YafY